MEVTEFGNMEFIALLLLFMGSVVFLSKLIDIPGPFTSLLVVIVGFLLCFVVF